MTRTPSRTLPDAVEALQNGDDIDYQGASGAIDMDENGDATAGVYDIYEYKTARSSNVDRGAASDTGSCSSRISRKLKAGATSPGLFLRANER